MNLESLFIGTAAAQESSPVSQATPPGGSLMTFLPLILVFFVFYFLILRPQSKQRKKHQELINNLKKGDEVVTLSGIHGKVANLVDSIVHLEVSENVRLKMDKHQVALVKTAATTPSK
ncbi:MAG: preprotein translocase subunit YajC [Deltaproteobacteria bacterium]|nr:preprotein translocase subunit YajC [Deltaproteobacteria bacterium]